MMMSLDGFIAEEISKLKEQPGKNLAVAGVGAANSIPGPKDDFQGG